MMVHDPIYDAYQHALKKEAKYSTRLTFIKKPVAEYSSKDFVMYFQKKFEEIYEVPYELVNIPVSCNVIKAITTLFYKAGFENDIVMRFIDHELRKGKANSKIVKLRTLQYGVTEFLYRLKQSEKEFKEHKETYEELAKTEEDIWNALKRKWKK